MDDSMLSKRDKASSHCPPDDDDKDDNDDVS
jgi:hypothetical protein